MSYDRQGNVRSQVTVIVKAAADAGTRQDGSQPPELTVTLDSEFAVTSDPAGHAPFIGQMPGQLQVSVSGGQIQISGPAPFVPAAGPIAPDGSFTASSRGTVAGFPDIRVTFQGRIEGGPGNPNRLEGEYTMGAEGGLPEGQPITYGVQAQRR